MKKRKNIKKKAVSKKESNKITVNSLKKEFMKENTKDHLFGIKILVVGLLLYAVYSLVMIILYFVSLFIPGALREGVILGLVDRLYLDQFISLYGQVKAENFFLLIGMFGSLLTFALDIWFSFGLWKQKNSARLSVAVFSLILLFISISDLFFAGYTGSMQVIWIVIYAVVPLYLLVNKDVIIFFEKNK
jgi:hypothetical protein